MQQKHQKINATFKGVTTQGLLIRRPKSDYISVLSELKSRIDLFVLILPFPPKTSEK